MLVRHGLPALVLVSALSAPASADAEWCFLHEGPVLPSGSVVPPRPRIAFQTTEWHAAQRLTATLDGKPVQVTRSTTSAQPGFRVTAVIESDQPGELVVAFSKYAPVHYTISPTAIPRDVSGAIGRARGGTDANGEEFQGLMIWLPAGTPALFGHVRYRSSKDEPWESVDVPVYTGPDETRPAIRLGDFGCGMTNANLATLSRGVEIEVTATLADATIVPVTGLAKRITLPEPLPPQPRPKNQR